MPLSTLPVELLTEVYCFLPNLGDCFSLLQVSRCFYNVWRLNERGIGLEVLQAQEEIPWDTACLLQLVGPREDMNGGDTEFGFTYRRKEDGSLTITPEDLDPTRALSTYKLSPKQIWKTHVEIFQAYDSFASRFARLLGRHISLSEKQRFISSYYVLSLYLASPVEARASFFQSHDMKTLLQALDVAKFRYLFYRQLVFSSIFGRIPYPSTTEEEDGEGNKKEEQESRNRQIVQQLSEFTNDWNKAVKERLDDDGYFDPCVIEAPYEAPQGIWSLFDEYQSWVLRVKHREDVRLGAVEEGSEGKIVRGVLVGHQVGGGF